MKRDPGQYVDLMIGSEKSSHMVVSMLYETGGQSTS